MKGYTIQSGYMGYVPSKGTYQKFDTEDEYVAWYRETQVEISYYDYIRLQ